MHLEICWAPWNKRAHVPLGSGTASRAHRWGSQAPPVPRLCDTCSASPGSARDAGAAKAGGSVSKGRCWAQALSCHCFTIPTTWRHHSLELCSLKPWSLLAQRAQLSSGTTEGPDHDGSWLEWGGWMELVWEILDTERTKSISQAEHGSHTFYLLSRVWHVKGASTRRRENAFQSVTFSLQYSELKMH